MKINRKVNQRGQISVDDEPSPYPFNSKPRQEKHDAIVGRPGRDGLIYVEPMVKA